MPTRTVDRAQLRRLVDGAKKNRKNRMYYEKYFNVTDVKKAGIIPSEEQSNLDRLTLDLNRNESIHLFGFDQNGSYFDLQITVVSLFASSVGFKKATESKWRLGKLDFVYYNAEKKYKYSYNCEELLDYDERRNHADKHESRNLLKIGSLSLETVLPFSISRILINGLVTVEDLKDGPSSGQLIPIRLNISLHPTCDKFDYSYLFSKKYLVNALEASADDQNSPEHLLELLLEDRFDQALMFQGHLEKLRTIHDKDEPAKDEQFIMWGAKCKKILEADKPTSELERSFERLYVWAESGQQIHLSRPRRSNLINGMVHNSFDYASPLGDVKLFEGDQEIPFSKLGSFNELSSNHQIKLVGFKNKQYSVEFSGRFESQQPIVSKINGFDGFAATCEDNLAERCREAQKKLWTLVIGDRLVASKLANESLLGGKGNSLIDLARCSSEGQPLSSSSYNSRRVGVSVPRGFIVTCVAYKLWLESEPKILEAINELDCKRRSLSAQSIYLNPMSPKHNSVLKVQQILREQCAKTYSVLNSCPLPEQLRGHISSQLLELFGDKVEAGKMFAVRSSAVGEDSLETSAAGQMRTILDAQGLDSICKSIVECWSSQFELEAVTYKTQNGLAFNLPMAVVVQELIQCKVAGVAATCDPLNGNKNQLEITANVGLGEGVVSGKQTDTVRVSLGGLRWDPKEEDHMGLLSLRDVEKQVEKLPGEAGCCLDDKQIISLSNLLLKLRRLNPIKEREVEWGITMTDVDSSSSSSSSSSDDDDDDASFAIHLLQSRPFTHLQRLTTREVDHELDYGHPSAMDIVSRANLGEVMPGALSTLNASYYQTITTTYATHKPYQAHHSRCPYVADSFGFHSGMAVMVVSYSDTVARFSRFGDSGGSSDGVQMAKAAIYSMIGSTFDQPEDETLRKKLERFYEEKLNPNSKIRNKGLAHILGLDLSYSTARMSLEFGLKRLKFVDEAQKALDHLIEVTWRCPKDSKTNELNQSIRRLYKKLITETSLMSKSWMLHIGATIVSMSFNFMCLKLLSSQPAYAGMDVISSEILNDFSVLIGGGARSETLGEQTESGDISLLLNRLLESFLQEGQLELIKTLDQQKLYEYLADEKSSSQSSRLFREFMQRNGHRAYKEFCMATRTWSDDCSYIIRLLSMRLKTFSADEADRERKRRQQVAEQRQKRLAEVEAKVVRTRFLLMKYAIPKAQQATIRRERSKSLTIEVVHKFRLAFRYLGGLLCLAGRLPNAELIFFISIQELDEIIAGLSLDDDHDQRADLSRIIYKARRRQQRARAFEKVKFPRPTMEFHDMVATIREQVAGVGASGGQQGPMTTTTTTTSNGLVTGPPTGARHQVKGLTSCGGCVTGRACVVSSLDEMDQIQENDILVTYSIDISWSVYFFALAGIVTEVGGIVSHGAVVAREYGIPTLCTALGACSAFTTGQLITLDADKGVCYLAEVAGVAEVAEAAAAADDHH